MLYLSSQIIFFNFKLLDSGVNPSHQWLTRVLTLVLLESICRFLCEAADVVIEDDEVAASEAPLDSTKSKAGAMLVVVLASSNFVAPTKPKMDADPAPVGKVVSTATDGASVTSLFSSYGGASPAFTVSWESGKCQTKNPTTKTEGQIE